MSESYKLILKSDFREAEKVLSFAEMIGRETGLENDLTERIKLALSEAATNAIVHGNKSELGRTVTIKVTVDDSSVIITVRDQGEGFAPEDIPDPVSKEQLLSTGGRGVFLIKEHCDKVEYEEGGRLAILTFHR